MGKRGLASPYPLSRKPNQQQVSSQHGACMEQPAGAQSLEERGTPTNTHQEKASMTVRLREEKRCFPPWCNRIMGDLASFCVSATTFGANLLFWQIIPPPIFPLLVSKSGAMIHLGFSCEASNRHYLWGPHKPTDNYYRNFTKKYIHSAFRAGLSRAQ